MPATSLLAYALKVLSTPWRLYGDGSCMANPKGRCMEYLGGPLPYCQEMQGALCSLLGEDRLQASTKARPTS